MDSKETPDRPPSPPSGRQLIAAVDLSKMTPAERAAAIKRMVELGRKVLSNPSTESPPPSKPA
jgi:hypothetical protein